MNTYLNPIVRTAHKKVIYDMYRISRLLYKYRALDQDPDIFGLAIL